MYCPVQKIPELFFAHQEKQRKVSINSLFIKIIPNYLPSSRIVTGQSRSTSLASRTAPDYSGNQGPNARNTSANWDMFRRKPPRHWGWGRGCSDCPVERGWRARAGSAWRTDVFRATLQQPLREAIEEMEMDSTLGHHERTRNNCYELKQERFWLDMRKSFLGQPSSGWDRLPKDAVQSPSMEVFKTLLDKALSNQARAQSLPCCEQEVGLETPELPSGWNYPVILWCNVMM